MPFRERLKKTFSRNSTSEGSESSSNADSNHSVYAPGEKIPQSKYRRPVAKEHRDKLEAFSFANAWRRKSNTSTYSPMGSRMPSRKNSAEVQQGRRGRSFAQRVPEGDADDTDVGNVGVSRPATADRPRSSRGQDNEPKAVKDFADAAKQPGNTHDGRHDTPFSPEELTLALSRSHLAPPPR